MLVSLTPEEVVAQIDFTYIDDALSPAEALSILEAAARNKHEHIDDLERDGFPAYTTSAGWLGYDDAKVDRLARQAVNDGFTMIKLKPSFHCLPRETVDLGVVVAEPARRGRVGGKAVCSSSCSIPLRRCP